MQIKYRLTPTINTHLATLDQIAFFVQHLPLTPTRRQAIRRQTQLRSSLFSARIEGNPLQVHELNQIVPRSPVAPERATTPTDRRARQRREINNLWHALQAVFSLRAPVQLSLTFIKQLHALTMATLTPEAGHFRTEASAIFNQAGVAIYLTPSPEEIRPRLKTILRFTHTDPAPSAIRAALGHYHFEKIHPFLDGNGRLGRLLSQYWLDRGALTFGGLLNFEEKIEQSRDAYYYHLEQGSIDQTAFVEYFLDCLTQAGEELVAQLQAPTTSTPTLERLLPRRQEILTLLAEHPYLSFDQLQRRFLAVKPATLRFDLRQLLKQGFILKVGETRGVVYRRSPST